MPRSIHGDLDGRSLRVAVLVARWNPQVTDRLRAGALEVLAAAGVADVTVVDVPGAFELPQAAARLAAGGRYDALVALGCVLKGETIHDRVIADACARGLMDVAVASKVPVTFGVVTADTLEQALARSGAAAPPGPGSPGPGAPGHAGAGPGGTGGHKGKEAADAAVRLATALRRAEGAS